MDIKSITKWVLILLVYAHVNNVSAKDIVTIPVSEDIDVEVSVYPASGDKVILWLACNEGAEGTETEAALELNKQGIEVWLPDHLSAHFYPKNPSSINKIEGREIARVIEEIYKTRPDKAIYLVAGGRANSPLLRGVVEWEKQHPESNIRGMVMLYPRLNHIEPVPGQEPVYIEAVGKSKLPIHIYEGERTPNRWGLPHLKIKLEQGGSIVRHELLPKVRGYFYTRPDKTVEEKVLATKVHDIVSNGLAKFK